MRLNDFMRYYDVVRLGMFVLLGFFLISFVYAADSSTESNFNIRGCTFDFEGLQIGVSAGQCSGGVALGEFFCGLDTVSFVTRTDSRGCSLGAFSYVEGDDFCCPTGMRCNATTLICNMRLENCVDQTNEIDCENNGCVWMDIIGECSENPREYDCSYYDNSVDCLADEWDIGISGVGTEFCGSTIECNGEIFSVSEDSCGCEWYPDAPVGEECQLKMSASQMFYDTDSNPDEFECSNVYFLGECIDGTQDVSWFSESSVISGFDEGIPEECLEILNCVGGESTRFCGEPIIKLSGFSLFSLLVSFFLIGIYYFISDRFKYKRGYRLL